MLNKISKFISLLRIKFKYPNVIYFGVPFIASLIGIHRREHRKGFYSQLGQDEIIFTEFFKLINKSEFPKYFIDIGCNHPLMHSNSYFFESNQGYKVLAVDALQEVHDMWCNHRPNAQFVECAVGSDAGETSFNVIEGGAIESMFSSVSGASQKKITSTAIVRKVQVRRMSDILKEHNILQAGIVSMDIEGYEFQALRGMDFKEFKGYVFIIENNGFLGLGCNNIRDLMIRNGYIYFARIWNLDDIFIHPDIFSLH